MSENNTKQEKIQQLRKTFATSVLNTTSSTQEFNYNFILNFDSQQKFQQKIHNKWSGLSIYQKIKCILKQFSRTANKQNPILEKNTSSIIKAWKCSFVFQREYGLGQKSLFQQAEIDFINQMKTWNYRYILMSNLLGINIAFILLQTRLLSRAKWYIRTPLICFLAFQIRNYAFIQSFERIYYPIRPIFNKHREDYQAFKRQAVTLKNKMDNNPGQYLQELKKKKYLSDPDDEEVLKIQQEKQNILQKARQDTFIAQTKDGEFYQIVKSGGLEMSQNQMEDQLNKLKLKYVTHSDFKSENPIRDYNLALAEYCDLIYPDQMMSLENQIYFTKSFQSQVKESVQQKRRPLVGLKRL